MSAQYFAQIDNDNIVTHVAVVEQDFLEANPERYPGRWVETFVDNPHKCYAGLGYEYLEDEQDFRPAQPYPSWTWMNKIWDPPTPYPTDGEQYRWSEEDLAWVAI